MSTENPHIRALQAQWERADAERIQKVYQTLASVPDGRFFLHHLLSLGKIGQQPFTTNALAMSFNCGELNVGQQILANLLAASPDGWTKMQEEANDRFNSRESSLRLAGANTDTDTDA